MLRIALAQINPTVGDLRGNADKIIASIEKARAAQADLVLFPEQAIPGYPAEDLLLKHPFVRDNLAALDSVARACRAVTAVVGFVGSPSLRGAQRRGNLVRTTGLLRGVYPQRGARNDIIYNAAAVLHKGSHVATYHKIHLPNYGVFDEKRYFIPGLRPLIFSLGGIPIGLTICEDIWVEDGPTGALAEQGAALVLNISASPYHMLKGKEREAMLSRRARKHKVWIAYANMVGGQDEIVFDGQSVVIDPRGRVVSRSKAFEEDMTIVDLPIDVRHVDVRGPKLKLSARTARKGVKPVLAKRPEVEEEVLQALVTGTRDYVLKNGFQKVILGLSGGVDSALVAAVAAQALGPENVIALFMPSRFSSVQSLQDAQALSANLKITMHSVPIDGIFQSYAAELKPFFEKLPSNIAEENLQARIRGNILMAFSNKFGWLVLTTGNKSETSVGYCTLYGDMAGGFAVIKDLFKEWVYRLSRHINKRAGREIIPRSVLTKEPTAELRANQKDSDSIPVYPKLDPVLKGYIEKNLGMDDLIRKGFDRALARRVLAMVDRNEYKRRQAPPGVKITPIAFGKDRRYPITNRYLP